MKRDHPMPPHIPSVAYATDKAGRNGSLSK